MKNQRVTNLNQDLTPWVKATRPPTSLFSEFGLAGRRPAKPNSEKREAFILGPLPRAPRKHSGLPWAIIISSPTGLHLARSARVLAEHSGSGAPVTLPTNDGGEQPGVACPDFIGRPPARFFSWCCRRFRRQGAEGAPFADPFNALSRRPTKPKGSAPGLCRSHRFRLSPAYEQSIGQLSRKTPYFNWLKLFILIIALVCLVGLAWVWRKKPGLKRTTARTWPAGRRKMAAQPRL